MSARAKTTTSWQEKGRNVLTSLGLMLGSFVVGVLVLEGFVRITEPPEVMRYFYSADDSVLHHKFIPLKNGRYKTTEFDTDYSINSLGLRDVEFPIAKPPQTFRILMVGDSFTEGDGVYSHETFARRLEVRLDSAARRDRYHVINAGVGSYSPLLEYLYLKSHGLQLEPDLVILNFDLSDVYDDINYTTLARFDAQGEPIAVGPDLPVPRGSWRKEVLVAVKDFCKHHFQLYNYVRIRLTPLIDRLKREENFSGDVRFDKYGMLRENHVDRGDSDWALTFRYLLLIRNLLRDRGIDLLVTVYPIGLQVHPREFLKGREYWGFKADTVYSTWPQEHVEWFCRANGIAVVNLCDDFTEWSKTYFPLYLSNNGHWVAAGHDLVAARLFQSLLPYLASKGTRTGTASSPRSQDAPRQAP